MTRKMPAAAAKKRRTGFASPEVGEVFKSYSKDVRSKLMSLRELIFDTASATDGVGELAETLKWGQPAYLTKNPKSGSTIRIDRMKSGDGRYAMYFHCQTDLVPTFRELYPTEFTYGGNRSIEFDADANIPEGPLRHCVALALTYHLGKTRKRS